MVSKYEHVYDIMVCLFQFSVGMATSESLVEQLVRRMLEEWKSASMRPGALCAMMIGIEMMPL